MSIVVRTEVKSALPACSPRPPQTPGPQRGFVCVGAVCEPASNPMVVALKPSQAPNKPIWRPLAISSKNISKKAILSFQ